MKKYSTSLLSPLWKGLVIGGTMLVPGASGGSMAMILGIYSNLITAVSSFFKNPKKNLLFLGTFVAGAGIGMLLFAKPLLTLIETYPKPMLYFFLGAVLGGVPLIYHETGVKKLSSTHMLYILIGVTIVLLFSLIPSTGVSIATSSGMVQFLLLLACGIIAAVALILPGISISYLLLVMGLYDTTIRAISTLDIRFLFPLGLGVGLGIILTTGILEYVMKKYPRITYFVILGFVLGSLFETFPGLPMGLEWVICTLMFGTGYFLIRVISSKD